MGLPDLKPEETLIGQAQRFRIACLDLMSIIRDVLAEDVLCRLGNHDWRPYRISLLEDGGSHDQVLTQSCCRCGAKRKFRIRVVRGFRDGEDAYVSYFREEI